MTNSQSSRAAPILLSVVIPYHNDDHSARAVLESVSATVGPLVADYEIIIVDNGSDDDQFADYLALMGDDGLPNVQVYRLLTRVENDIAAWAGVENSLGDYVLVYNPRSEDLSALPEALAEVAAGTEVIFLRNLAGTDFGFFQSIGGPLYRWLFRKLTGIDLRLEATPGRLISKRVVSFLLMQSNPGMVYRIFPARAGFIKKTLTYVGQRPRIRQGSLERIRSGMRLLISTSMAPLRLVSLATLAGAMLNVLYSIYVLIIALLKPDVAPGWTTLSLQQSGMFFLISMILFVLTEYMIQLVRWQARGPNYLVDSERTSVMLSRRQRLNIEQALEPASHPDG